MSRKLAKTRIQSGFTIIEVMIVLAIAGLILSVVLIAVPQLQKSQRNEARRSIMARISTEISNYAGNNNGRYPSSEADIGGLKSRYLDDDKVSINDPSSGNAFVVSYIDGTIRSGEVPTDAVEGTANYKSGMSCSGESLVTGTNRSYALYTLLEGGAIYCVGNL